MSVGKHNVGHATVPPKGVKVGTASDIHFAMHAAYATGPASVIFSKQLAINTMSTNLTMRLAIIIY
jgi:hypothetical protein